MEYRKVYTGKNVIEYYEYRIEKLKKENSKLKEENKKLKDYLNEDVKYQRIQEAIRKLNSAKNHYSTRKEDNAIIFAIKILKGDKE
jgi:predicted nuclease with TOPRIM domain